MKGGLFRKLVLLYLLLISVLFFIVNTLGPDYMKKQLIDEKEQELYHETGFIAQRYVEPYYVNHVPHYIMENMGRRTAAWQNGNTENAIQGDLTVEELKQMIDSIYS